jgi:hypothetical protein
MAALSREDKRTKPESDRRRELINSLAELEAWGSARDWSGSDPYDGLNAKRLVSPVVRTRRGRQAVTQLVKHSPLDLRPLLGIRPAHSAAALAQIVSSYARYRFLPTEEAPSKLADAIRELEALRCAGFDEPCWGYHFDVQTRVFFYPKGAPNTIATSFAGLALLDAFETTGEKRLLDLAEGAGDFFMRHIPPTQGEHGAYFGYLVDDQTPIHNANMLVCALLARLAKHLGRKDFREAARAGTAYTVAHQRPDGSWPYGERERLGWVDGLHTGYVLESLAVCAESGVGEDTATIGRGLDYYRERLFLEDGAPKYYESSTYPIDIQCAAQGIQTFARCSDLRPDLEEMAWSTFHYALRKLRRSDGAFVFQRRRIWQNRTPHVRWAAAPMLLAMTYLFWRAEQGSPP